MHLDRRPAGVEGPADRAGREAVDGRPAARLDVGDQLQPPGQLRLQRPGRDRGEVGLEQHVVDRLGQQPGQRLVRLVVLAGQQVPGVRRQAVERRSRPSTAASVDRPEHLVGAGPRPARPLPARAARPATARRSRRPGTVPVRQRRERRQRHRAGLGHVARRPARAPARSRPCRRCRASRPAPASAGCPARCGPVRPSARRAAAAPRRRPGRSAATPGCRRRRRRWPAGRRPWRSRRAAPWSASSTCSAGRGRLEVAHAEAAAAQRRRRLGAPLVEQQLDPAYRLERRARRRAGRPVARCAPSTASAGTSSTRSTVVCPPRSASPTSPGTTTEPVPRGTSSLRASSSSAGVAASAGSRCAGRRSVVASPPAASDVLEHRPGRLGQLGQPRGDLGRRRRGRGDRAAAR